MKSPTGRGERAKHPESASAERGGITFKFLLLIAFALFLFVLYLARNPILRMAGNFWVVDEPPETSDAIVVLSDDNYYAERAARAAEVFKAGWAPRIVVAGRQLRPYAGIAELMQHDLVDRGVPAAAVVRCVYRAENTREEAEAVNEFLRSHGWKRVIVVTSNYHTRRARYIWERSVAAGTQLRMVAAHDSDYDPNSWWLTRTGLKTFAREVVGLVEAMWEMRHKNVQSAESAGMVQASKEARTERRLQIGGEGALAGLQSMPAVL
jgi:vancomycin permeability regulator SanA